MILLHRLRGEPFHLNPDLIESIEQVPDTRIRLVDSRTLIVREVGAEVAERVLTYRASVLAAADRLLNGATPSLRLLVADREEG